MTIKELVEESYRIAKEHGWHDGIEKSDLEHLALVHSEISEAVEEIRKDVPPIFHAVGYCDIDSADPYTVTPGDSRWNSNAKPEGALIELADAIIRIADMCGAKGWDLEEAIRLKMAYNETRSYRHGNKKY